jgi:hypothetical protein
MNDLSNLTGWLLAAQTPSIRYLTLRRLLRRPESDPEVQAARQAMAATGPIPAILAEQVDEGHWHTRRNYYSPKYTATHWSMMLLAELAADRDDPRLRRGAAFMLTITREVSAKAISLGKMELPCFWGNLLRYVLHGGQADDPRVQDVVDKLVRAGTQTDWRCRYNADLPCSWGAARALWGLAALPVGRRTPGVEATIASGLALLLEAYNPVEANYPARQEKPSGLWSRTSFPLFYQADILFVLRVLDDLGALDHPGAEAALEWLAARRKSNGRWRGASPYRRRTWDLGEQEETSRWVSLHAAVVLGLS